jgi:hypothetical protein
MASHSRSKNRLNSLNLADFAALRHDFEFTHRLDCDKFVYLVLEMSLIYDHRRRESVTISTNAAFFTESASFKAP